ncbi:MAG: hypothetical protein KY476_03570 [Planctomycetes bacterium]|nr:hypothetical protein [Planctomycetota bacterium]
MDFQQRLERLERQHRRLKQSCILALLIVGVAVAMGQAPANDSKVVKATGFVVTDADGNERAAFGFDGRRAALVLSGDGKKPSLKITTVGKGRSAIFLYDAEGKPRAELSLAKGGPVLNFIGGEFGHVVGLSGTDEGAKLVLRREEGNSLKPIFEASRDKLEYYASDGTRVLSKE